MNDLSWLLYFADIAGNLKSIAEWVMMFILFGLSIFLFVGFVDDEFNERMKYLPKKSIIGAITVCLLIVGFVPSPNTIYLIAGSEMGEEVLKTDAAKKVEEYLTHLIDKAVE